MILLNKGVYFMSNYIKLNNNDSHLSLGNMFNIIKKLSINKSSAIQTEIFCILFSIDNISETTVGNYCTGYRAIGSNYKQIYLNYKKKYQSNKNILIPTINNLISIIDGYIYDMTTINEINDSKSLKNLCKNLNILVKNDLHVPTSLKKNLLNYLSSNNYYEYICEVLFFIILEKKQPLYEEDLVNETIEEILSKTNISLNDLKKYLQIEFKEGISFIPSLKKLAKENNPYALYQLGNLEYTGIITGYPRYEEAYNYHKQAASFNHPTSYWMLAHMILNKKIGSLSDSDITLANEYLDKAISLNSISALNTKGLCYLNGWNKDKKIDIDKAISYFKKAIKEKYIYAYNNLGRIYESQKHYEKALEYFLVSADEEESWACNKVALYYYNGLGTNKDIEKAYYYFNLGANAPINNRNNWNIYNLVVLFYLKGNATLGIKKDIDKSILLLENLKNFDKAEELLLYTYYEKYLTSKSIEDLNKVKYYLSILNNTLETKQKKKIEQELNKIYDYNINIKL